MPARVASWRSRIPLARASRARSPMPRARRRARMRIFHHRARDARHRRASARERDDAPNSRGGLASPLARQPAIRRRRRRDGLAREGTRARERRKIRVARLDARRGDRTHLCERRRRTSSWEGVTSRPETCAPKSARVETLIVFRTPEYDVGRWFFRRATSASSSRRRHPRRVVDTS